MDAIDKAIAAAEAEAATAVATPSTEVATRPVPAGPTVVQRGTPMSLTDFSIGGIVADDFLKVKDNHLRIGNKEDMITEPLIVDIDMTTVQVTEVIKFGNPAQYLKTVDGITCVNGGTWAQAVEKAQKSDPNARPYKSADLTMVLVEDAVAVNGKVIAEKGTKLGHSLSTTNRGEFQAFLADLQKSNLLYETVRVKVGYKKRTNSKGNVWGVLTFELLGKTPDEDEADE